MLSIDWKSANDLAADKDQKYNKPWMNFVLVTGHILKFHIIPWKQGNSAAKDIHPSSARNSMASRNLWSVDSTDI